MVAVIFISHPTVLQYLDDYLSYLSYHMYCPYVLPIIKIYHNSEEKRRTVGALWRSGFLNIFRTKTENKYKK